MVIANTGFWLALANRKDKHHAIANVRLTEISPEPLITTWPIATETCHLLGARISVQAQQLFLSNYVAGAFTIFDLTPQHIPRLIILMKKYASLPMDLADGSLVILAEHLGHGRILSTDERDFETYKKSAA
ncbi:MAG: PIN domain-containing protein [Candidatus Competibacter sp.]|nr:PIN domain-containing protein [Candidatus Competibacter sp.]